MMPRTRIILRKKRMGITFPTLNSHVAQLPNLALEAVRNYIASLQGAFVLQIIPTDE